MAPPTSEDMKTLQALPNKIRFGGGDKKWFSVRLFQYIFLNLYYTFVKLCVPCFPL